MICDIDVNEIVTILNLIGISVRFLFECRMSKTLRNKDIYKKVNIKPNTFTKIQDRVEFFLSLK
jgi:hypothetical protein